LTQSFSSPVNPFRIKALDTRLANQIAAGEVVERPASVVKELLENALDSGATRIELDVERGGTRLIQLTDNGCGIVKEDLALALARHATSKISTSSDLACITTLGFRGEALASISSVSKLCLTSRTKSSEFAWQVIAEGRDMVADILPAAATVGTRIEVRDLFYNTPARQKFLKAERTEFNHIEEIFKRHALANSSVAFILKHNNKVVKRIPATQHASTQPLSSQPLSSQPLSSQQSSNFKRRLESICGSPFSKNADYFTCEHGLIKIKGWLGGVDFHRSESDIQYVFLNGRPVKDKMLNHAIRQAYHGLLPSGRMPTYVVFLTVNADKIDVNVHPTKHEVRFDDQRMVHDLLVKSISEQIHQSNSEQHVSEKKTEPSTSDEEEIPSHSQQLSYSTSSSSRANQFGVGYSKVAYIPEREQAVDNTGRGNDTSVEKKQSKFSKIRLDEKFWIVLIKEEAYLVNEEKLLHYYLSKLLTNMKSNIESRSTALLFPQSVEMDTTLLEDPETINRLEKLGFVFEPIARKGISLQKIPAWLIDLDTRMLVEHFENWARAASLDDSGQSENQDLVNNFYPLLRPLSNLLFSQLIEEQSLAESKKYATVITSKDLQPMIDNN